MDTSSTSPIQAAQNAITSGISSEQAIETLKSQSAQITTEFLGWLKNAATDAASFVNEQTPLFVQEFLTWHFFNCVIRAIMWLLLAGFVAWCTFKFYKRAKAYKPDRRDEMPESFARFLALLPSALVIIIFWNGIMSNVMEAVKIKVAPRVYLVDWLAETLTGNSVSDANSTGSVRSR